MNYAIGNTNIIHGKRPIFNGFTKIKCDCIGSSIFATTTCNNLSDLLIGYDSNSNLSDFITVVDEGANTKLIIDHDGTGALVTT
jgi:hypothetical protein